MKGFREYQIIDVETGEKETFLLKNDEVELLEKHAKHMEDGRHKWSALTVLAYSVRMLGIEEIQKRYETPAGGAARDHVIK